MYQDTVLKAVFKVPLDIYLRIFLNKMQNGQKFKNLTVSVYRMAF